VATLEVSDHARAAITGGTVQKSDREIMEILEAFDATGCAHSAAQLAGVDPKTVRRYVAARDAGRPIEATVWRAKIIDPFLAKIEELVDRSDGNVRADVVHQRLQGLGVGEPIHGDQKPHPYLGGIPVDRLQRRHGVAVDRVEQKGESSARAAMQPRTSARTYEYSKVM